MKRKKIADKALGALDILLLALWTLLERAARLGVAIISPCLGIFIRALEVLGRSGAGVRARRNPFVKELGSLVFSPASKAMLSMASGNARSAVAVLDSSPLARRLLFAALGLFALRACVDYESRVVGPWDSFSPRCVASYYDRGFLGKPTASGELYSPFAMTAAHRTLPFGSWVRVRNLRSGAEAVVRINDRGPYIEGRDIDLFKAAARKLGILDDGLASVELQILSKTR